MAIQPINPQRLTTILAHLVPPSFPLAPDLLSSALKTRQVYLPPNPRNPHDDRFIAQRPSSTGPSGENGEDQDPEEISKRLTAITQHLSTQAQDFSTERGLQGEGNDLEVALFHEWRKVKYRALDGETVVAGLDLSAPSGGVRILFVPEEGEEEQAVGVTEGEGYRAPISMGDEWKLFDVRVLENEDQSEAWAASPAEALATVSAPKEEEREDDYWGGYSDEETSKQPDEARQTSTVNPSQPRTEPLAPPQQTILTTKKVTISPFVSRFNTPLNGPDDAYWSSYGNVEDGLKQSNPSSPHGVSRQMTPGAGYWGTGGESPVSWSPPAPNVPLPARQQDAQPQQTLQTQLQQAATTASRRTEDTLERHEGHVDLSSPALDFAPGSPASFEPVDPATVTGTDQRQTALRAALTGLKFMYINTSAQGIDQEGLQNEFAQVLREFL